MDFALLGTGGSMPMPNRFLSSLLLKFQGRKILVDCGEGTQVSMRILKWGFKTIDIICISHEHGDHIYGLPGLLLTIGNSGRTDPITIIGPEAARQSIGGLISAVPRLPYDVRFIGVAETSIGIKITSKGAEVIGYDNRPSLIISTLELDHSRPCIGFNFHLPRRPKFNPEKAAFYGIPKNLWKLLQGGETLSFNDKTIRPDQVLEGHRKGIKLSYITDTRPIKSIPGFIDESDVLICEATYADDEDLDRAIANQHMTFSEAAKLAQDGKVGRLILTHFGPSIKEPESYLKNAEDIFPQVTIGYDRYEGTLTFT